MNIHTVIASVRNALDPARQGREKDKGMAKKKSQPIEVTCPECKGTGLNAARTKLCAVCDGHGSVKE